MKCLIPLLTQVVVLTKFGVFPVKAEFLCNFPETVAEVQPDGSTKCVCDTSRGFCGQKEDTCYPITCTGNKLLQRSCECVCPPDYVETIVGKCIPRQPTRVTPTCKDGEVVLSNGQCGVSTTTKAVTTTTTSSPPVLERPFEVNVTKVGPTYAILCVRVMSSGGNDSSATIAVWLYRTLDEFPMWYRKFEIGEHNIKKIPISDLTKNTSYELAVRVSLDKKGNGMDGEARIIPIHTKTDEERQELDTAYHINKLNPHTVIIVAALIGLVVGTGCVIIAFVYRKGYICRGNNNIFGNNLNHRYPPLLQEKPPIVQVLQPSYSVTIGQQVILESKVSSTLEVTSVSWERICDGVPTIVAIDNIKYQGSSVGNPSLVIKWADMVDTGIYVCTAFNSTGTGRSTEIRLSVTGGNESEYESPLATPAFSEFSYSTVDDDTKLMKPYDCTATRNDLYPPSIHTCSNSYRDLSQQFQSQTGGHIYQPNTDDYNTRRQLVTNGNGSLSMQRTPREHQEAVNENEDAHQDTNITYNNQTQADHPQGIYSFQRAGGTQPLSN